MSGADKEGEGELKIFEHLRSVLPAEGRVERCLVVGKYAVLRVVPASIRNLIPTKSEVMQT